jgi:outer membrane protein
MKISWSWASRLLFVLSAASVAGAAGIVRPSPAAAAESKIAVVDVAHVFEATEEGQRARAILKKAFDKAQQEIDNKKTELSKEQDEIEKQQRILSREAVQRRMEAWQRRGMELQARYIEHQQKLQKRQDELTAPILQKIKAVIARLAKKSGYELILDKLGVAYVRQDLDVTDQVIQMFNSGGEAGEAAPEEKKGDGK